MSRPDGFAFDVRPDGSVALTRRGRTAATLRDAQAAAFLAEVAEGDPQRVMAHWSGLPGAAGDRPLAVFDLDGTLADVRHRLHHLASRPKDWDAFFRAAVDDAPLAEGVALVHERARTEEIAYVTGRPERCRADTERWLERHGLPPGRLLMRRADDRRAARVAKPELLRDLARGRTVSLVVDDDEQVCRAYRDAGFPVRHAHWAASAPAVLTEAQEKDGRT